jgi:putative toxin-antitoxin system antitoxin component (TIGR02293 family)
MPTDPTSTQKTQPAASAGNNLVSMDEVLESLKAERTLRELWKIASRIGMSAEQFENITEVSPHKLRRGRGGDEKIDLKKNASIARCAKVFKRVLVVCNRDEAAARNWLNAPAPVLKNARPIESAQTAPGAKAVEALIAQLEKAIGISG